MKILWIVNTIFPYPSKKMGYKTNVFGGWLIGLFNEIKNENDIQIAVATVYNGNKFLKFSDKKNLYYLLPTKNNTNYDKKLETYWKKIVTEFKPDITHIHGTEYAHGLSFQKACPNIKNIVSIQGLISVCADSYISNINLKDILINITLKDIIRKSSIIDEQIKFKKRGKIEEQIIKNSTFIVGRTNWDRANTYAIAGYDKYHKCNENLRDIFYDKNWDISKIEKHSIFISQASYPLKGFHIVLKAIAILKKDYSDLKVYIAGPNITKASNIMDKMKMSGYSKYIISLIKEYNLDKNIIFLGIISEDDILNRLLKSHVFVQASSLENSSNSLAEAMILGVPCVASNVGGTSDLLQDKIEGFLYPFGDYALLSYYIDKIFKNDDISCCMGKNAQKHARKTHNKKENVKQMVQIYKLLINKN